MLQAKVSSSIEGLPFDDIGLEIKFSKIYRRMHMMEKGKYLPPKFSQCFSKLAYTFGVSHNKSSHRKYIIPIPNYDNSDMISIFNEMNEYEIQSNNDQNNISKTIVQESKSDNPNSIANEFTPEYKTSSKIPQSAKKNSGYIKS